MKTTYRKNEQNRKPERKKSSFWEFMGGEFLLHRSVVKWYPYILFLFVLAAIIIYNEKSITEKNNRIDELDKEYKNSITELRENNQFIPYDSTLKLIKILEDRGFEKNDKTVYKIPVTASPDK